MGDIYIDFDLKTPVGILFTDDTKPIVNTIKPNSQASGKGIIIGHIITKLNEIDIVSKEQFKEILSILKNEEIYKIKVKFTDPNYSTTNEDVTEIPTKMKIHKPPNSIPSPIYNVKLNSDDGTTTTQIYCELDGQEFYIGSGLYTPASNSNSWLYHNIFLPFYGRGASGRFFKHPSENGSGEADTIISFILNLMKDDCIKEVNGNEMTYCERKVGERYGYNIKANDGHPTILSNPDVIRLISDISDILGEPNFEEVFIDYYKVILDKMHYPEDGPAIITREGNSFVNAIHLSRGEIEGLNGKQWGSDMGGKHIDSVCYRSPNLMTWLQRYRVDDEFVQLKTAINLTKSLMDRYPDKSYSYGPSYLDGGFENENIWYRYILNGESVYEFSGLDLVENTTGAINKTYLKKRKNTKKRKSSKKRKATKKRKSSKKRKATKKRKGSE